jgi:hypothetical protein
LRIAQSGLRRDSRFDGLKPGHTSRITSDAAADEQKQSTEHDQRAAKPESLEREEAALIDGLQSIGGNRRGWCGRAIMPERLGHQNDDPGKFQERTEHNEEHRILRNPRNTARIPMVK